MTLDSVVSPQVLNKYSVLVDVKSGIFTVVLKRNVAISHFISQNGYCSHDKNLKFSEILQRTIYHLKYQNPIV